METKIIQVKNDPYEINASNEAWGRWGWSVLSVQVTHSQNTREYQDWAQYGSNEVTVETTTINYATITYQRDKGMPSYDRIVELEQEYNQVENRIHAQFKARREELYNAEQKLPKVREAGGITIVAMLLSAYFFFASLYFMFSGTMEGAYSMSSFIIIIVGSVIVFAFFLSRYMKSKSPENQALRTQRNQMQVAINAELTKMSNTEHNMIEAEKTRIINESAQLLRTA